MTKTTSILALTRRRFLGGAAALGGVAATGWTGRAFAQEPEKPAEIIVRGALGVGLIALGAGAGPGICMDAFGSIVGTSGYNAGLNTSGGSTCDTGMGVD